MFTTIGPPPKVVTVSFTTRLLPVSTTPARPVVRTAAGPAGRVVKVPVLSVVVPPPATCSRLSDRIPLAVTLFTEMILSAPKGVVSPTRPVNVMSPAPAVSVRACVPSSVLENRILPKPTPVSIATGPDSVVGDANVTSSSVVVTSPAVVMPRRAVRLTGPSAEMSPAAIIAIVPD